METGGRVPAAGGLRRPAAATTHARCGSHRARGHERPALAQLLGDGIDPERDSLWRRCLVLGPAPEYCLLAAEAPAGVAPGRLPSGWTAHDTRARGASGVADVVIDAASSQAASSRRQESRFRDWVGTASREQRRRRSEYPPEAGRYHLYVSLACPWCHRTAILRELAGLQQAVGDLLPRALPRRARLGVHAASASTDGARAARSTPTRSTAGAFMSEAYSVSDPELRGADHRPGAVGHTQRANRQQRVQRTSSA